MSFAKKVQFLVLSTRNLPFFARLIEQWDRELEYSNQLIMVYDKLEHLRYFGIFLFLNILKDRKSLFINRKYDFCRNFKTFK